MLDWLLFWRKGKQPPAQPREARQMQPDPAGNAIPKAPEHAKPLPEPEPVSVRGDLWKNTGASPRQEGPQSQGEPDRIDPGLAKNQIAQEAVTGGSSALKIRLLALKAKNQIAQEAVTGLIKGLMHRQLEVRHQSSHQLRQIGRAAVPKLMQALADNEKDICQVEIARILGWLGPNAAGAVPALVDQLTSEYAHVRQAAAEALGQIGQAAGDAVPALIRVLADWHPGVREAVARSLGQVGPSAQAAAATLVQALSDPVEEVWKAALEAIGRIGAGAVPPLTQALTHPNIEFRLLVAEALWRAGAAVIAVPVLTELLLDQKARIYLSSASLLFRTGEAAKPAVRVLVREAARADRSIVMAVQNFYARDTLLGQLCMPGEPFSWNGFLASLNALGLASDLRIRQAVALIVLLKIGVPALREAAQDSDGDVRQAASQVLSWMAG